MVVPSKQDGRISHVLSIYVDVSVMQKKIMNWDFKEKILCTMDTVIAPCQYQCIYGIDRARRLWYNFVCIIA